MPSAPEADFREVIRAVAGELTARDFPFMLIGGQAVLLHGEPRLTQDIDVTLGAGPDRLADLLDASRAAGLEPLPRNPTAFVRDTLVLPAAHPESAIRVDFIFSLTPYEAQAIERAVEVEIHGTAVPFASAEDLLIHKLFAGRPRDLEDARGVVRRKGADLDWDYLARWAREFASVPGHEGMPRAVSELEEEWREGETEG